MKPNKPKKPLQDKALLASYGIVDSSDCSSTTTTDESEQEDDIGREKTVRKNKFTENSDYNWFQLVEVMESEIENNAGQLLEDVFAKLHSLHVFEPSQLDIIVQAFTAAQGNSYVEERMQESLMVIDFTTLVAEREGKLF